jgi:hypothetical protein
MDNEYADWIEAIIFGEAVLEFSSLVKAGNFVIN